MFTKKQIWTFISSAVLVALIVFLVIPYGITNGTWGWPYNAKTGVIGDTIGGTVGPTVGFIGAILTFLAFYIQYQANELQRLELTKQEAASIANERLSAVRQIEGTFFELLKLHKDNVKDMMLKDRTGIKVLVTILYQFYGALRYVNKETGLNDLNLTERDRINIAYLITYFGVNVTSHNPLDKILIDCYPQASSQILAMVAKIRASTPEKSDNYGKRTLAGHQSRLSHYYRNLFMIVTFIHENEVLNNNEKKRYIKILRVQLSIQEQILFFFNSLSVLGQSWELGENVLPINNLITRYQLIRNIPSIIEDRINPKEYYPLLKLEQDF